MRAAIGILNEHLKTFKNYLPRQAAVSFNNNKAIESILKAKARQ
ncbi:hypothetical protein [Urechidicola sp. KH5]